jgi:outer membrane protein TolC
MTRSLFSSNIACQSFAFLLLVFLTFKLQAQDTTPLPEPLTLEFALQQADMDHPHLLEADAALAAAQAAKDRNESRYGFKVGADLVARWVDPPPSLADQGNADHRARVYAKKRLYDFGQTNALSSAAERQVDAAEFSLIGVRQQRRIDITKQFFNVLLADLEYARDNEKMAIDFISYDRIRERNQLGQTNEVDLLEAQALYQTTRKERFQSLNRQRAARSLLAIAMNRTRQLSAKLMPPALNHLDNKIGEFDKLVENIEQKNPVLKSLTARLDAARLNVQAARNSKRPDVSLELEAGAYERELGNTDRWRAGVVMQIPIYQGGAANAQIALQQAELQRIKSQYELARMNIEQRILELWLEIDNLQKEREERAAHSEFREFYLDRARTLYEMEVKADLGDAMVQQTDAILKSAQTDFQLTLAWMELKALTGDSVEDIKP